jgi:diacylglycerol kinase (ATP)
MRNKFLNTGQPGFHPLRKIRVVLRGLRFAVVTDFSVAYKLALSLLMLIACIAFRDWIDVAAVLIATALMLVAEIFNTAIEALCDFVEARDDYRIGVIKDIAAAGVGISIFLWLLIMAGEAYALLNNF